jgi:hypothetical protein
MRRGFKEEYEDTGVGRSMEEDSIHDSFYAAPTSGGSLIEIEDGTTSICDHTNDDLLVRPNILAEYKSDERLILDQKKNSNATIRQDVASDDSARSIQTNVLTTNSIAELSRPSLAATKKHISLRRAAIWNAARKNGLDFWKFGSQRSPEAGSESTNAEENVQEPVSAPS